MTLDELSDSLRFNGIDTSYAVRLAHWVYKKRNSDLSEIPNISKSVKRELSEKYESGLFKPLSIKTSADKTEKYLFRTSEGLNFESVFIPDKKRKTLCVSAQSGCRMGCTFCLTGKFGFRGDLSAGEIINQIISHPYAGDVTNVVFMGMGEPMDNLEAVLKACNIITAEWGLSLSSRNITVSTVGIPQGIIEFLEKSKCNLTLSLHSPFPEERSKVIPVEKKYPFKSIMEDLAQFHKNGIRRISIAYIMIEGMNDTDNHLSALKALVMNSGIRVNLLPYNKIPDSGLIPSSYERMLHFKHNLVVSGISASIRKPRGSDISAACGLLAVNQV